MSLFLGVDGGGTNTRAAVVDASGKVLGRADGGPVNYQSIGLPAAKATLQNVVSTALARAGTNHVDFAAYGVAGADRPKDFDAVESILPNIASIGHLLVNDCQLVLRGGTNDGIGIAVVSGTGTNALARDARGRVERVGGYCFELGDFGSGGDLGREALRAAMRGQDGRDSPTALYDLLCEHLGVRPLEDVLDRWIGGSAEADIAKLAPMVFRAASDGDEVAKGLLSWAGRELALSIKVLARRLFADDESVAVVLGGSVLQQGGEPTLIRTIRASVNELSQRIELRLLRAEPVFGAALLAFDLANETETNAGLFRRGLGASLGGPIVDLVE
jgi:N-acetylglucosamine kinase-like BadF-type ATPase